MEGDAAARSQRGTHLNVGAMKWSTALGVGLAAGALAAVGHGAVVSDWDHLVTDYRELGLKRGGQQSRGDEIARGAGRARRHLLAGRESELGKILQAARLRRVQDASIALSETSYWGGDVFLAGTIRTDNLAGYFAVLTVSSALRDRLPVPVSLWSWIAAEAARESATDLGAAHGARLASVVAAVNAPIGKAMARRQLRVHTRQGDVTGAARALLLLGALELRGGRPARARTLTERAAYRAAANSDGGTVYAALAQLAEVSPDPVGRPKGLCLVVPRERERIYGDCLSTEATRLWNEGRIDAAVASFRAARTAGERFGAWWDMDFASRTTPILLGLGRWDEFDALVGAGIEAAARAKSADVEAELWLRVALSARARGYPGMAARAIEKARPLARTTRVRVAVEVSAARLALVQGSTSEAEQAYESALELAGDGAPVPFDIYLLAADLAMPILTVRPEQQPEVTSGGLSLLQGLSATVLGLDGSPAPEKAAAAFSGAALRVAKWADSAGRSDRDGALAAARSVWVRLARVLLATDRPTEALLAVERLRSGLRDGAHLAALRRDLSPGTGVLVFADLSNELWWWAVDSGGVVAGRISGTAAEVRGRSAIYAGLLRRRGHQGARVAQAARALSERVMGAVFRESGWGSELERIVIVPAAGLGDVPIDTLPLPSDPQRSMSQRYLVTRTMSLGDLHRAMASRAPSGLRIAFVPRAGRDAQGEARAVGRVGARVFVGPSATRAAFLKLANGAELVHFGGHALAADMPGGAAMSFARASLGDHVFRASDVAQLELEGATVVLLGCDTGAGATGPLGAGTRSRSLAEAFVRAGGKGVAASLWPIDDESARELASALYSRGGELPTASSLSRAKATLRRKYPTEPHRWAGFVWYGPPGKPD